MAKLHELLAVEGNLKGQAEKIRTDLTTTFEKKRHLFERKVVTVHPLVGDDPPEIETQSELQSTVRKELEWVSALWTQQLDVSASVAATNMSARADVILDGGQVLLTGLPATALLELEKRLSEIMGLLRSIPTLDPAKGFTLAPSEGVGVYAARADVRTVTKKMQRAITLYDATPEHPAQTQLISEDVPVGKRHTLEWSGLITPAEKAEMLARCESLQRAIKQARARANEAEVQAVQVGSAIFGYILNH